MKEAEIKEAVTKISDGRDDLLAGIRKLTTGGIISATDRNRLVDKVNNLTRAIGYAVQKNVD